MYKLITKERTVCVLVFLAITMIMYGCLKTTVPDSQDPNKVIEKIEFSPEGKAIGDAVQTGGEAVSDFIPQPWGTLVPIAFGIWQLIRNVRLTTGSRRVAKIINETIKSNDGTTWKDIGPKISEAESKYVIMKPIMPDKA